jgi:hypothetical protein
MIEEKIIKIIKSLDRITDTFDKLTIRRTLLIAFTILLLLQTILTIVVWLFGREISNSWVEITRIEYVAWATMFGFYFYNRGRNRD